MKKMLKQLANLRLCVMPATAILFCSWENPGINNYANRVISCNDSYTDTLPKEKQDEFDKAMKQLNENMASLDKEMNNLNENLNNEIAVALSEVDIESIAKETEASLKQIDWNKMQQDLNISLQNAQQEIAKIDLSKLQTEMKELQEKFKSEEFKSQINSEKWHKEIEDAMSNAKVEMENTKQQLQQMKDFTDALAAEGLIDKKKGFTIEWKSGELYINSKKQSKDIADKYRRYEKTGKIKILPDGAEHF